MVNQIKRIMKELSIEEKAKRYDEAIEKARQLYVAHPTTKSFISDLQDLFPELRENEDERIWEKLISYFSDIKGFSTLEYNYGITSKEVANWLKSLKDRYAWKPSDEQMKFLWKYAEQNNCDGSILTSLYNDLKKLKL